MAKPYHLVRDTVSRDTVEALELLLADARKGRVVGIAFGAMLRQRRYLVNCAGDACRDPTTTRGILAALDDELSQMVQGAADAGEGPS